ncbi:11734_t:CDS:2 [Acaulospora morrowiae]|uniref:11734_t:CDS:1 n=1 Tax=Acaulospora morrowiae TaxID=94023 RepID=A0A9N8VAX1_9GLOM|nr:11734_t:CDS:2 [Acaulospora morrowiae]
MIWSSAKSLLIVVAALIFDPFFFYKVKILIYLNTFNTAIAPCSISNTTSSSNEMPEDFEDFVTTHEALKTILLQVSNEEITKYEKQLSSVKNLDPVLIISQIKFRSISRVGRLIMQSWMLLQQMVFKIGAKMRILVVSFTSQLSPNSILYAEIFTLFKTPSSFLLASKLKSLMLNCTLLERREYNKSGSTQ